MGSGTAGGGASGGSIFATGGSDGSRMEGFGAEAVAAGDELLSEADAVGGTIFGASPANATETDSGFVIDPKGRTTRLYFRDEVDGGMVDRVWDGYPIDVARPMREAPGALNRPQEIVPDVRMTATVSLEKQLDEFAMAIEVLRPDFQKLTYALAIRNGKGTLEVRGASSSKALGKSEEFAVDLKPGEPTQLSFAHVDEQLIA